ncbi:Dimodular nonribosomal peptide synthase [Phytophthora cinnamomi]|uniref:Dimodular nonribosomal peptide synthase n=1 Tax=Phytophthora cinnamomi TaxID=4785 RepID=UPI00355A608E|nr:Dimodular nonribosomal peptide synthase [Phytophthora cinnamomi]
MEAASTTEEPPDTANASPSQLVAVSELISAGVVLTKRHRKHYTIKKKRTDLQAIKGKSEREAARSEGIPRWTLNDWRKDEESIFAGELITFMKDARRDSEVLTATPMACYVRDQYPEWLESYMVGKKDAATAYESLLRLLRRFAYRHGFVQRTPSGLKVICS